MSRFLFFSAHISQIMQKVIKGYRGYSALDLSVYQYDFFMGSSFKSFDTKIEKKVFQKTIISRQPFLETVL
jgi:hypothetical protein